MGFYKRVLHKLLHFHDKDEICGIWICPEFDILRSNVVIYGKAEDKDCLKSSFGNVGLLELVLFFS